MLENITKLVLAFCNDIIIIPLVIVGYIWIDKCKFYHAICLLLLSMICNVALKSTFQIPLSTHLAQEGFAFPSGHMQTAAVLYGWLMLHFYAPMLYTLLVLLLTSIAYSLVALGYHNWFDVVGGILFGSIVLFSYFLILKKKPQIQAPAILLLSTLLMVYIHLMYTILDHVVMAYLSLVGFMLGEYISPIKAFQPIKNKLRATLLFFITVLVINVISKLAVVPVPEFAAVLNSIKWLFIAFAMPCSLYTSQIINTKQSITS